MEDLVRHLPKLATGPSFQRVTPDHELYHVTENRGQEDLHPEPQWIEECWHREINLGRETYKILLEIGQVRNRQIAELVYRREERADMQAMQERARQESERDKDWKKQGKKQFCKDYEDQSEADNLERGSLARSNHRPDLRLAALTVRLIQLHRGQFSWAGPAEWVAKV